jgi:hypothetical protein
MTEHNAGKVDRGAIEVDVGGWMKKGAIGGLIAGILFAMVETIAAAALMGLNAVSLPLRMIGGIALGRQALGPTYPLLNAALAGLAAHLALSMLFGAILGAFIGFAPTWGASTPLLLFTASVYGLLLWFVNFSIIAPSAGWNWFGDQTNPAVQFVAHTFFYGTALGFYLDRYRP